jgi:GR25 family glycosyltransferase involved in LPS biosynthesis
MTSGPFYINLDSRTDRKEETETEFKRLDLGPVTRIPAVCTPDNGAIGCLISHINLLESQLNEPTATFVCEDDVQFLVDNDTLNLHIDEFMKSDADILCLGYNSHNHSDYSSNLMRSHDLQTTSCYIIKPAFRRTLYDFWKSVLDCIRKNTEHPLKSTFMIIPVIHGDFEVADQCWKLLQQSHTFVIPKIRCAHQRGSYSDIMKCYTAYNV